MKQAPIKVAGHALRASAGRAPRFTPATPQEAKRAMPQAQLEKSLRATISMSARPRAAGFDQRKNFIPA
jgi:hypothetical protein